MHIGKYGRRRIVIIRIGYIWQEFVLVIIHWFKVDYCFSILSDEGFVYYLIFKWCWGHRFSIIELLLQHRYITTSMLRILYIVWIKYKTMTQCYVQPALPSHLCLRVDFLLAYGSQKQDHTISLTGDLRSIKLVNPAIFFWVAKYDRQCVLDVCILSLFLRL